MAHGPLAASVGVTVVSIGFFNFFGISVTKVRVRVCVYVYMQLVCVCVCVCVCVSQEAQEHDCPGFTRRVPTEGRRGGGPAAAGGEVLLSVVSAEGA